MTRLPDDATVGVLRATLDRAAIGAAVTASNLANVDTPGYRAQVARFQESVGAMLRMARSEAGHRGTPDAGKVLARVVDAPVHRMRFDGNTVDLDREMTHLAMLRGRYTAAAQLVRKRFALMRYAVTDGRG